MNILMDIDDVLADLVGSIIKLMNQKGVEIKKEDIVDWQLDQFVPEGAPDRFHDYFGREDIYHYVSGISGGIETVKLARELGHRVIFCTSAYPGTEGKKLQWLNNHGYPTSREDYVECSDKSIIKADLIIDDRPKHIEMFPGAAVVFTQPWNAHLDFGPGVFRANSHKDLQHIIKNIALRSEDKREPHPIEIKYPEQTLQFRNIIDSMYAMHLEKNQDYSPANINSTGEIGLSVRIMDKVLRALNLTGFDVDAIFKGFNAPKNPKYESLNDNIQDIAVYAVNWLIYRSGNWGK